MQIRRVRNDEDALRRYVQECWLPYQQELSETVPAHTLVDDLDEQAVVESYIDLLDSPSNRLWILIDDDRTESFSMASDTPAGFVRTTLQPSPQQFDWPLKLSVDDFWVRPRYRGSEVAADLLARVVQQAREDGATALTIDVSVDNERAIAFAEKHGLEVQGRRLHVPLQDVALDTTGPSSAEENGWLIRRIRAEEAVMRQFVEECWLPFWRDLGDAVGEDHLSPDFDRDALVEELLDGYDVPDRRCWVALDDVRDRTTRLDEIDAVFAGWINAGLEPTSEFLDPPERLFIGNLYAQPDYRGSGLADELVARALQCAREEGCTELSLGVEVDNERAMAYYQKLGFEPLRQRMAVQLDSLVL